MQRCYIQGSNWSGGSWGSGAVIEPRHLWRPVEWRVESGEMEQIGNKTTRH